MSEKNPQKSQDEQDLEALFSEKELSRWNTMEDEGKRKCIQKKLKKCLKPLLKVPLAQLSDVLEPLENRNAILEIQKKLREEAGIPPSSGLKKGELNCLKEWYQSPEKLEKFISFVGQNFHSKSIFNPKHDGDLKKFMRRNSLERVFDRFQTLFNPHQSSQKTHAISGKTRKTRYNSFKKLSVHLQELKQVDRLMSQYPKPKEEAAGEKQDVQISLFSKVSLIRDQVKSLIKKKPEDPILFEQANSFEEKRNLVCLLGTEEQIEILFPTLFKEDLMALGSAEIAELYHKLIEGSAGIEDVFSSPELLPDDALQSQSRFSKAWFDDLRRYERRVKAKLVHSRMATLVAQKVGLKKLHLDMVLDEANQEKMEVLNAPKVSEKIFQLIMSEFGAQKESRHGRKSERYKVIPVSDTLDFHMKTDWVIEIESRSNKGTYRVIAIDYGVLDPNSEGGVMKSEVKKTPLRKIDIDSMFEVFREETFDSNPALDNKLIRFQREVILNPQSQEFQRQLMENCYQALLQSDGKSDGKFFAKVYKKTQEDVKSRKGVLLIDLRKFDEDNTMSFEGKDILDLLPFKRAA